MATYKKPLPPGAAMQEPQQASSLPPDVLKLIDGAGLTSEMDDAGLAARTAYLKKQPFGDTRKQRDWREDLIERETTPGFGEGALTGALGRERAGLGIAFPVASTASDGAYIYRASQAAQRAEEGIATANELELLKDIEQFFYRSQYAGVGFTAGRAVGEASAFLPEFAIGGAVWKSAAKLGMKAAGKAALTRHLTKAGSDVVEAVAKRWATTAPQMAQSVVAPVIEGMGVGARQYFGQNLAGHMVGGAMDALGANGISAGRTRAGAMRDWFSDNVGLSLTAADSLIAEIDDDAGTWLSYLPKAILDDYIEMWSEASGAMFGKAAMGIVPALKGHIVRKGVQKYGADAVSRRLSKIGIDGKGPFSAFAVEMLEEAFGAGARDLAGRGLPDVGHIGQLEGSWEEFWEWENLLGTMLGMGLISGATGGTAKVLSSGRSADMGVVRQLIAAAPEAIREVTGMQARVELPKPTALAIRMKATAEAAARGEENPEAAGEAAVQQAQAALHGVKDREEADQAVRSLTANLEQYGGSELEGWNAAQIDAVEALQDSLGRTYLDQDAVSGSVAGRSVHANVEFEPVTPQGPSAIGMPGVPRLSKASVVKMGENVRAIPQSEYTPEEQEVADMLSRLGVAVMWVDGEGHQIPSLHAKYKYSERVEGGRYGPQKEGRVIVMSRPMMSDMSVQTMAEIGLKDSEGRAVEGVGLTPDAMAKMTEPEIKELARRRRWEHLFHELVHEAYQRFPDTIKRLEEFIKTAMPGPYEAARRAYVEAIQKQHPGKEISETEETVAVMAQILWPLLHQMHVADNMHLFNELLAQRHSVAYRVADMFAKAASKLPWVNIDTMALRAIRANIKEEIGGEADLWSSDQVAAATQVATALYGVFSAPPVPASWEVEEQAGVKDAAENPDSAARAAVDRSLSEEIDEVDTGAEAQEQEGAEAQEQEGAEAQEQEGAKAQEQPKPDAKKKASAKKKARKKARKKAAAPDKPGATAAAPDKPTPIQRKAWRHTQHYRVRKALHEQDPDTYPEPVEPTLPRNELDADDVRALSGEQDKARAAGVMGTQEKAPGKDFTPLGKLDDGTVYGTYKEGGPVYADLSTVPGAKPAKAGGGKKRSSRRRAASRQERPAPAPDAAAELTEEKQAELAADSPFLSESERIEKMPKGKQRQAIIKELRQHEQDGVSVPKLNGKTAELMSALKAIEAEQQGDLDFASMPATVQQQPVVSTEEQARRAAAERRAAQKRQLDEGEAGGERRQREALEARGAVRPRATGPRPQASRIRDMDRYDLQSEAMLQNRKQPGLPFIDPRQETGALRQDLMDLQGSRQTRGRKFERIVERQFRRMYEPPADSVWANTEDPAGEVLAAMTAGDEGTVAATHGVTDEDIRDIPGILGALLSSKKRGQKPWATRRTRILHSILYKQGLREADLLGVGQAMVSEAEMLGSGTPMVDDVSYGDGGSSVGKITEAGYMATVQPDEGGALLVKSADPAVHDNAGGTFAWWEAEQEEGDTLVLVTNQDGRKTAQPGTVEPNAEFLADTARIQNQSSAAEAAAEEIRKAAESLPEDTDPEQREALDQLLREYMAQQAQTASSLDRLAEQQNQHLENMAEEAMQRGESASVLLPPPGTVVEVTTPQPLESIDDIEVPDGTTVVINTVEESEELGAARTKVAHVLDPDIIHSLDVIREPGQGEGTTSQDEANFAITVPITANMFSAAERAVEALPNKKWGGKNAVDDIDRSVKKVALQAELEAIGWDEIKAELKAEQEPGRPITREQVLGKMQKRRLVLKTVVFSGEDVQYSPDDYEDYWRGERTTGATRHIEVAVLLDGFEEHPDYLRDHFELPKARRATPGMIGWIRFAVETPTRLRMEEMQSDLEQQIATKQIPPEYGSPFGSGRWRTAFFKLAMMRAAELGYKELSWPTGEEIMARNYHGTGALQGYRYLREHDPELAEEVGAHGASRIAFALNDYTTPDGKERDAAVREAIAFAREDARRPGEPPVYSFVRTYDIILPQIARKLGKKLGIGTPRRVEGTPILADQKTFVEVSHGKHRHSVPIWWSAATTNENGIDGERQYVSFVAPQIKSGPNVTGIFLVHLAATEDASERHDSVWNVRTGDAVAEPGQPEGELATSTPGSYVEGSDALRDFIPTEEGVYGGRLPLTKEAIEGHVRRVWDRALRWVYRHDYGRGVAQRVHSEQVGSHDSAANAIERALRKSPSIHYELNQERLMHGRQKPAAVPAVIGEATEAEQVAREQTNVAGVPSASDIEGKGGMSTMSTKFALTMSVQDMNIARAAQGLRPLYPSDRRFGDDPYAVTDTPVSGPATSLLVPGADPRQSVVLLNKYLANLDQFLFERDTTSKLHSAKLDELAPVGLSPRENDKWVRDRDAAMLLYIDTKNALRMTDEQGAPVYGSAQELYNTYRADLSPEQRRLWELSQSLERQEPRVHALAEQLILENDKVGTVAVRNGVIGNKQEVYAARLWFRKGQGAGGGLVDPSRPGGPLRTKPGGRQKQRVYDSVLQGQALGETLRVPGAIEAQRVASRQVGEAVYNSRLIDTLKSKGIIAKHDEVGRRDGYMPLRAPQFIGYVAPRQLAKTLNAITETYDYDNLNPVMAHLIGVNSWAKHTILTFSFFHHQAFMRSSIVTMDRPTMMKNLPHLPSIATAAIKTAGYAVGLISRESVEASARNMPAYEAGRQAILSQAPELVELVRAGLTVGSVQDLEPALISDLTDFRRKLDGALKKMGITPKAMQGYDSFVATQRRASHWLFNNMGAHLKVQGAMVEYAHLKRKYAAELAMPWDSSNPLWTENNPDNSAQEHVARLASEKLNADFGGLNLRRSTGKLFKGPRSVRAHMALRMVFLAPDWTESNLITAVKAIKSGSKAEQQVYRDMWANVAVRFVATTMLWNFMMAGFDWDEFLEDIKEASAAGGESWHDGVHKLYWTDMNMRPLAALMNKHFGEKGVQTGSDKYFSLMGHFRDPLKWGVATFTGGKGPVSVAKGKASPIMRTAIDALSGSDWAGRQYTNISDLTGVSMFGHEPDPELRGKFVSWAPGGGEAITPQNLPSFIAERVRSVSPIQLEASMRFLQGEIDTFDWMGKMVGMAVHRTYPPQE
jgi:hypothetical protein